MNLTYQARADYCHSLLGKKLLQLMDEKKTNLALSADVRKAESLITLAKTLGPHICILKTHIDIIDNFTPDLVKELQTIAKQHHFFIFEDRKFADIGHTVKHQYAHGIYRIVEWADMINAHILPGPAIIQGLEEANKLQDKERGLILIAEMSSKGHLMNQAYIQQTLRMAEQFPHFVLGFITQRALSTAPQWVNFTPGIHLSQHQDNLGQQYKTPEQAILTEGTDIIIVGRAITEASHPQRAAQAFCASGWQAYLTRCKQS